MPLKVDWSGVYPAVPTQFNDDFSINLEATRQHVEALLDNGVHGLIMLGTIGENCSLSLDEKVSVLEIAVATAAGRVPVLNGVAEFTTANACETARRAESPASLCRPSTTCSTPSRIDGDSIDRPTYHRRHMYR